MSLRLTTLRREARSGEGLAAGSGSGHPGAIALWRIWGDGEANCVGCVLRGAECVHCLGQVDVNAGVVPGLE
jgi:hypothetical protein